VRDLQVIAQSLRAPARPGIRNRTTRPALVCRTRRPFAHVTIEAGRAPAGSRTSSRIEPAWTGFT
jgi:hypothetical protein